MTEKKKPLIITVAITGAETSVEKQPALPITSEQQIKDAIDCFKAGASIVHLHVRDDQGKPSQDLKRFSEVIQGIRASTDMIVQISTGGAVGELFERRLAPLGLPGKSKPEMASLNMGSINFGDEVFQNLPSEIHSLISEMNKNKIKPELEIYDLGMLEYSSRLIEEGKIQNPAHFQFVMGTPSGIQATEENLKLLIGRLPESCTWTAAGIGRFQLPMNKLSMELGGHVRVGFEDNIYLNKGQLAESNSQFVERIVQMSSDLGRSVADPKTSRELLALKA